MKMQRTYWNHILIIPESYWKIKNEQVFFSQQLNNYLKINQDELQKSKSRLNDYNLVIGPETQKYVDEYDTAMKEFKNETRLMSEGFKRAIADQIMPAFTSMANLFREGFPGRAPTAAVRDRWALGFPGLLPGH